MPLLDIATAQSSVQNHISVVKIPTRLYKSFIFGNEKSLASGWKSFKVSKKEKIFYAGSVETQRGGVLMIRAIATLKPVCSFENRNGQESRDNLQLGIGSRSASVSSSEDSEELDERERLRRTRISEANKGNMPWNRGRKHSAETIQRIRERTRLAMQDPKVKMKLVNLRHAQSKETRTKIGVGVRIGWERRRQKLMLLETCYFEWQNLIAEASRSGFLGEEELEWDSYMILNEQLQQEWLASIEKRKIFPTTKTDRRAPKPLEHRRKISEAISAKWTNTAYRDKVCSALSKYYGTPVGAEKKLRRRPSCESQPRTVSPKKKKLKDADNSAGSVTKSQNHHTWSRRSKKPLYKDPLASSKLEMIKNIRAHRAAAETEKTKATIKQAKLLIAEAEKAAKALEPSAMSSPLAQASLIETRKLIAEAIQSIQSAEIGQINCHWKGGHPSISMESVSHPEEENNPSIRDLRSKTDHGETSVQLDKSDITDLSFSTFYFWDLVNGKYEVLPKSTRDFGFLDDKELHRNSTSDCSLPPSELNGIVKASGFRVQSSQPGPNGNVSHEEKLLLNGSEFQSRKEETALNSITVMKKWVRGRLVDVVESDQLCGRR